MRFIGVELRCQHRAWRGVCRKCAGTYVGVGAVKAAVKVAAVAAKATYLVLKAIDDAALEDNRRSKTRA